MAKQSWRQSSGPFGGRSRRRQISKSAGKVEACDAVTFARERLGFEPDEYQIAMLRGGKRGIVKGSRQTGKSWGAAAKAVHRAESVAGSLTLVLSPSERQSAEFMRKVKEFVRRLGAKTTGNKTTIVFPNGSRIIGLPESPDKLRGFSNVSLLLIDEAAFVSDATYTAMRPTLAASDGDLWLFSTPNGKRGFFWREWANGGALWERISVTAENCDRVEKRFLEEERSRADPSFRREYLGEFMEREGAAFSQESIDAAYQDYEAWKL